MHTNRHQESSRETELPGPIHSGTTCGKRGCGEKCTQKTRGGWGAPLGALVRRHRGGIGVNQETLSQLRAGPTLSSAHPGKSFSSDSAHKQRKPFLPRDGRWINCIMLSQELLFQVYRGEKKRNERQCICSQLWVFSSEAGVSKHSIYAILPV